MREYKAPQAQVISFENDYVAAKGNNPQYCGSKGSALGDICSLGPGPGPGPGNQPSSTSDE